MYILLAILIFGILVAVHELGHFMIAKAFGVQVNEFAIGMGPVIVKKRRGETLYSWRVLPIGGFCAMEGEDENSENPRAFTSKPWWQRAIILVAGAAMNFLLGFLIVALLYSGSEAFSGRTVVGFSEGFQYGGTHGLMEGDEILSVDGHRVFYANDFAMYMERADKNGADVMVRRDGRRVKLDDYPLQMAEFEENGQKVTRYGIYFDVIRADFLQKAKYACLTSANYVRFVWMGLEDLFSGAIGLRDMSGPVGIVTVMDEVGENSASVGEALENILFLAAFIAVNLAVMNLLPVPALDGGRVFFLILTGIIEFLIGRKIDPKYEGYIHAAGLILLLGFTAFVMVNDIARLFHG